MAAHWIHLVSLLLVCGQLTALATIHKPDSTQGTSDDYIVMYHAGRHQNIAHSLGDITGLDIRNEFSLGHRRVAVVKVTDPGVLDELANRPEVELIESNLIAHHSKPLDFVDRGDITRPITVNTYQSQSSAMCHQHDVGEDGWGIVRTSYRARPDYNNDPYIYGEHDSGQGVDIYVIDSGIYPQHEDFQSRAVQVFTAPLIHDGDEDLDGHGTHVAGTAGGLRFGIARRANLLGVKVLNGEGWGWWSDIVAGIAFSIERHQNKSKEGKPARSVINMSLGGGRQSYSYSMETAIQAATEAGVHVAVAAGNSYDDACYYSPPRSSVAISVGASNMNDSLATFSNYGPCVNIIAPGRFITGPFIGGTRRYVSMSGTSMSSPHVAGGVARYLSQLSDDEVVHATPAVVRAQLTDTASRAKLYLDDEVAGEVATPNRLLFKGCFIPDVPTTTTTAATTPNTTPSSPVTTVRPDVEEGLEKVGPLVVATLSVSAVMAAFNGFAMIYLCCAFK